MSKLDKYAKHIAEKNGPYADRLAQYAMPPELTDDKDQKPFKMPWPVWAAIILAIGYWIGMGATNPFILVSANAAKSACVALANENRNQLMLGSGTITADPTTWIREGRQVVKLHTKGAMFGESRLCVYGDGTVMIPPVLDQSRWM